MAFGVLRMPSSGADTVLGLDQSLTISPPRESEVGSITG